VFIFNPRIEPGESPGAEQFDQETFEHLAILGAIDETIEIQTSFATMAFGVYVGQMKTLNLDRHQKVPLLLYLDNLITCQRAAYFDTILR